MLITVLTMISMVLVAAVNATTEGPAMGQTPVGRMPVGVLWPGADLAVVDLQRPEVTVLLVVNHCQRR